MVKARRKRLWRSSARSSPDLDKICTELGKQIRLLRGKRKLTQEEAAELAHLDPKHWQALEKGTGNPTLASIVGIAKALGVPLGELFD